MSSYITSLIKITDFPETLINGELYCNTWESFDKEERKEVGDNTELTAAVLNTEIRFMNRRYYTRLINSDTLYTPIFCMTALYSKKYIKPTFIKLWDERFRKFGQYAVVITDVKEFLFRLNEQQPGFCFAPVEYIDFAKLCGKAVYKPIIKKDKYLFGYQQEFRIYNHSIALTIDKNFNVPGIQKINATAKKFFIGDLHDIAIEYNNTDQLFDGVSVNLKVDWNYCHKTNLVKDNLS